MAATGVVIFVILARDIGRVAVPVKIAPAASKKAA
jgi:hypothetical protein